MLDSTQKSGILAAHWDCKWALLCALMALCLYGGAPLTARAQVLTTIYTFCAQAPCTDGSVPYGGLVQGNDGRLYGTTSSQGANLRGTVFAVTPEGGLTTLYSFCSLSNCSDGADPDSTPVLGPDGNFYGTTASGGQDDQGGIFQVSQQGIVTPITTFSGSGSPSWPLGLALGANGNFYGTSSLGGFRNRGTVFEATPEGTVTTLYEFCTKDHCGRGSAPEAPLVQATDGSFYGTTVLGGTGVDCPDSLQNCGTILRVTPDGELTTIHNFCLQSACLDGYWPFAALVQGDDGYLYGVTVDGGANKCLDGGINYGCGTVFRISESGHLQTLYSFCSLKDCADGSSPASALVEGSDGNFYGTTLLGGLHNEGTAFRITPSGTFGLLYTFCSLANCADGSSPDASLVQDTNGKFYGTTTYGGSTVYGCGLGCGTVFSLSLGLGEFVKPQPSSGQVGTAVNILGTALDGATGVTFNGAAAAFTISSSSLITATVPADATTGVVEVVTPHGTIRSNVRFRVTL